MKAWGKILIVLALAGTGYAVYRYTTKGEGKPKLKLDISFEGKRE